MLRRIVGGIDLALFVALIAFGLWVIWTRPLALDAAAAASLAGALFGGAAVLLGNWINRSNERQKADVELEQKCTKLMTLIAAELVNVTAGLLDAKRLMDAAITTLKAGGAGVGQVDMNQYLPRGMPFTESLGVELLMLESPAVDALTTLRSNLAQTRRAMEGTAGPVKATFGLSLTTATALSNALAHDMTVLSEAFEHIAPTRKLILPGGEKPKLVTEILKLAAQPPRDPTQ
jgi:hypothetical protein